MKIKHFAGYGCVNATKISSQIVPLNNGTMVTKLVIQVRGNHERGIELQDWQQYDAWRWLLKGHFFKNCKESDIVTMKTESRYERLSNGVDEEVCDYTFIIQ